MSKQGLPVFHVALDCDEGELRRRIETDEIENEAMEWRLDHIGRFQEARSWLAEAADLVLDTTNLTPESAAATIVDAQAAFHPSP